MFAFFISGRATTASFRVPETHTFHQTLPLPPRTTVIGLMGAAMGLSLQDAHDFARTHGIKIGIYGTHRGLMRDLWNYRKVTGKEKNYTSDDIKTRKHYSILIREYLTDCEFSFFFGAASGEPLARIREALARPVYALTAGNSDDLLKITAISDIREVHEEPLSQFDHTILPGDVSAGCTPAIDFSKLPVTQTVDTPQVFLLPTQFSFNGDKRSVIERLLFTFVGSPVTLATPIPACVLDGKNIVML